MYNCVGDEVATVAESAHPEESGFMDVSLFVVYGGCSVSLLECL